MFSPTRLAVARKRRRFTKAELAKATGVALRGLTAYEAGETVPEVETLEQIAKTLKFPISFFSRPEMRDLAPDGASFRALTKMSAAKRDASLAAGSLAIELHSWIESRFGLPACDIPDLRMIKSPETAAHMLRERWGLGEKPIRNMVHLLEARGVRVFSLTEDAREVDAFCLWDHGVPFVFLNTQKSAERSRFDAAHELGHLVLHQHGDPRGREAERAADEFASAFLMPRGSVLASNPGFVTIQRLTELKKLWNVSVAALTHRLHDVGMISDWQYRTLMIEISKRGLRTHEPQSIERETSQILTKVFSTLKTEGVSKAEVARQLCVSVADLDSMIFGLVPFTTATGDSEGANSKRASLRVVKG